MALAPTLLQSVFEGGGRTTRYGDYMVVNLATAAFAVMLSEFLPAQNWARARNSSGSQRRDLTMFTERFETLLAHRGAGIFSKGEHPKLSGMVDDLTQMGLAMSGWSLPRELQKGDAPEPGA